MIKKSINNIAFFLAVFIVISIAADLYYYSRVVQEDSANNSQISYSDFRVLWLAAYNIRHHVIKYWNQPKGYPTFRPFWFVDYRLKNKPIHRSKSDEYIVYDKNVKYYHFRYSPFVAFIMIPLGWQLHQGYALKIWYLLLNITFLSALFLFIREFRNDFSLSKKYIYIIFWGTFIGCLRFYLINISLGQTDILIILLFVLFFMAYVRGKDMLAGIMLALILQFKLFFLPFLIYFLFIKRFKIILAAMLSFVCFLFAPMYMLGLDTTITLLKDWIEIISISIPSQILNIKNQSIVYWLGNLLYRIEGLKIFLKRPIYLFYFLSACLTIFSYILLANFKKSSTHKNEKKIQYLEISVLIMSSLLFSPIAWKSHFIVIMIPLASAIFFTLNSARRVVCYWMIGAFFILSCVVGTDLTKLILFLNNSHFANIALGSLFLLYGIIYAYRQGVDST